MMSNLYISDANNGNVIPPRSPSRTTADEYDYQMNNFSLIKAQLKASTYIISIDYFELECAKTRKSPKPDPTRIFRVS